MTNISIFKNFLHQQTYVMEELRDDNGGTFFRKRETFDGGGSVLLVISFNVEETIVDLNVFGIANVTNPLKKESLHELINNLNLGYRYTKFIESKGEVSAQYSFNVAKGELNPDSLEDTLLILLRSAQDSYPKFMKLQWS